MAPALAPARPLSDMPERVRTLLSDPATPSPCLVIDLPSVGDAYAELRAALPTTAIYYAVKANPHPAVLALLAATDAGFDVASPGEIARCLELGVAPERLIYSNTLKKPADIAFAHRAGVSLYGVDSQQELDKLATHAPGARAFVRIATSGAGADWPLSRKFGCTPDEAIGLLRQCRSLGLVAEGVAFHVGSQQRDPGAFETAIADAATVFDALAAEGIALHMLNIGGGFPARYGEAVPPSVAYGRVIEHALARYFGARRNNLAVIAEIGRGLIGNAGWIGSQVILAAERDHADGGRRQWIYCDVGVFNGLAEALGESIRYPIYSDRSGPLVPCTLAGPTCDSVDILYERRPVLLPSTLEPGDQLIFASAGAYTYSYSAIEFNGLAPLAVRCTN